MDFDIKEEIFKTNFEKLIKKYKNKRVLLYGAGQYFDKILENHSFKELNIIGISDLRFEQGNEDYYKNYKTIKPSNIKNLDVDVIIVTLVNYPSVKQFLINNTKALIEWVSPSLEDKKRVVNKNYSSVIEKIKTKKKLRIGFLVNEAEKWQYGALYEKFSNNRSFEPLVLITKRTTKRNDKECFIKLYNFFKNQNIEPIKAFDEKTNTYIDINKFNIDLLFYQQPWELDYCQNIFHTSRQALTFYCPYAISESSFVFNQTKDFFSLLYCHFLVDKSAKKQYLDFDKTLKNLVVVSHPKLDNIINKKTIQKDKKTIIYAPHHSFSEKSLNWATFLWSADTVLNLAKKYPCFSWILKPHPGCFEKLIKDTAYTKKDLDNFLLRWQKIGSIETKGSYFDLFLSSNLLITDCGSFIVEYLFTKNPCIHLLKNDLNNHSLLNQKIIKTYYSAKNEQELEYWFDEILVKNNDSLKTKRLNLIKELDIGLSSDNILNFIKKQL